MLCMHLTGEYVKEALFDIDDDKAPGLDEYTSQFYKKSWHCVGQDVIEIVLDLFHIGRKLKQINAINLYLIPKCEQLVDVS